MKPLIALLLVSCCCIGAEPETGPAPTAGGTPAVTIPNVPPIEPPEAAAPADHKEPDAPEASQTPVSPSAQRISDFQNDEITLVLRTLARQAGVSVFIDSSVTGTVTIRVYNQTPRATLATVCAAKNLVIEEQKGVLFIRNRNPPSPGNNLLKAAVVLCGFLALAGWFTVGMLSNNGDPQPPENRGRFDVHFESLRSAPQP